MDLAAVAIGNHDGSHGDGFCNGNRAPQRISRRRLLQQRLGAMTDLAPTAAAAATDAAEMMPIARACTAATHSTQVNLLMAASPGSNGSAATTTGSGSSVPVKPRRRDLVAQSPLSRSSSAWLRDKMKSSLPCLESDNDDERQQELERAPPEVPLGELQRDRANGSLAVAGCLRCQGRHREEGSQGEQDGTRDERLLPHAPHRHECVRPTHGQAPGELGARGHQVPAVPPATPRARRWGHSSAAQRDQTHLLGHGRQAFGLSATVMPLSSVPEHMGKSKTRVL